MQFGIIAEPVFGSEIHLDPFFVHWTAAYDESGLP